MAIINRSIRIGALILCGTLTLSCIPVHAFTLRDTRELCKRHRFLLFAAASAGALYLYSHKIIQKAIQDYKNRNTENKQATAPATIHDYCEVLTEAFIKATKLVGTLFKVFRATTCPDEGKLSSDQWLDDFSQIA